MRDFVIALFLTSCLILVSCEVKNKHMKPTSKLQSGNESTSMEEVEKDQSFIKKENTLVIKKNDKLNQSQEIIISNEIDVNQTISEDIINVDHKIDHKHIHKNTLIQLIEQNVNNIRKDKGLSLFANRRNLKDAATIQNDHCNRLSQLTHEQNDIKFKTVRDRIVHYGGRYSLVGENILYYGFLNNEIQGEVFLFPPDYEEAARDIVKIWVESPVHFENIINRDFAYIGTALEWNDQLHAIFVTQVYGG